MKHMSVSECVEYQYPYAASIGSEDECVNVQIRNPYASLKSDWHWREGTNSDASDSRLELEPNNDSAVKGNGDWVRMAYATTN